MQLISFLFGLIFGSFYNVLIYRLPNDQSIIKPPSTCGHCQHQLKALDLIPVLSYVILKGRCRYCNEKVSIQYPLVELATGFIFLILYNLYGLNIYFFKAVVLSSIVFVMSMIDLKHYIIPDEISIFTIISGLTFFLIIGDMSLKSLVLAFLIGGGFLFIIAIIGPMGGGDIKIMAGFALYLGLEKTILALLMSFVLGGIIGVLLILFKIKGRKDHIPFGPFLGLGTLMSFIYFNEIFTWYINFLR